MSMHGCLRRAVGLDALDRDEQLSTERAPDGEMAAVQCAGVAGECNLDWLHVVCEY